MEHGGLPGAIGVYFLEHPEPTLVDPGPATSLVRLTERLQELGIRIHDLRRVLLTHVHLDHAGATGHLVQRNPRITVHLHSDAVRHMADPARLVASTRRTFGAAHDELWGEVLPVPDDRLQGWLPGDPLPLPGIRAHHTPGHIAHHLAWEAEGPGVLFAGDSLGIVLDPEGPSHPVTPAPGVDLSAWSGTLDRVFAEIEVRAFGVTHFGWHADLADRRSRLREGLEALARRVGRAMEAGPEAEALDREAFHRETVTRHVPPLPLDFVEQYFTVFSARTDWDGMRFHLERSSGTF